MALSLRVLLAEDDAATAHRIAKDLRGLGHLPLHVAKTGAELIERARLDCPDLIVASIRLGAGSGMDAAEAVYRERPVAIILASTDDEPEMLERAEAGHIFAYLVKPLAPTHLRAAIALAVRRFQHCRKLEEEIAGLRNNLECARQALEDRKMVERAKGAVMRVLGIDEEMAYRRMRRSASDGNVKLIEVARRIIEAEEPFRQLRQVDRVNRLSIPASSPVDF